MLNNKHTNEIPFNIFIFDTGSSKQNFHSFYDKLKCEYIDFSSNKFSFAATKNSITDIIYQKNVYSHILFMSQDVIPTSTEFISILTESCENYAAIYCKQIVQYNPYSVIQSFYTDYDRIQSAPLTKFTDIFLSNACSLYNLEILTKNPFPEWSYTNEDQIWALLILNEGYQIKYNSKTSVINLHDESPIHLFKKYFDHGNVSPILYQKINQNHFKNNKIQLIKSIVKNWHKSPITISKEILSLVGYLIGSYSYKLPENICIKLSNYPNLRKQVDIKFMRKKLKEL